MTGNETDNSNEISKQRSSSPWDALRDLAHETRIDTEHDKLSYLNEVVSDKTAKMNARLELLNNREANPDNIHIMLEREPQLASDPGPWQHALFTDQFEALTQNTYDGISILNREHDILNGLDPNITTIKDQLFKKRDEYNRAIGRDNNDSPQQKLENIWILKSVDNLIDTLNNSENTRDRNQLISKDVIYKDAYDYLEKRNLNSSEAIENLVQNGTYEDFKVHLVNLNGLFRDEYAQGHEPDGKDVHIDGLVPIPQEYKECIIAEAFETLKDMPPRDRGALMYHLLGEVHLFGDGNGRSQRVWCELFSGMDVNRDELKTLTKHDKEGHYDIGDEGRKRISNIVNDYPDDVYACVASFAYFDEMNANNLKGIDATSLPLYDINFTDDAITNLPVDAINYMRRVGESDCGSRFPLNLMTMHELAREDNAFKPIPSKIINNTVVYDTESVSQINLNFSQAERFLEINIELKQKLLRTMINMFKNPNEYSYNTDDGSVPAKERLFA